jgi:hypothetical protein
MPRDNSKRLEMYGSSPLTGAAAIGHVIDESQRENSAREW